MKRWRWLHVVLLVQLASCMLPGRLDRNPWLVRWVTVPACPPPCWENIVPGKTTLDEARRILTEIPAVEVTGSDAHGAEWLIDRNDVGMLRVSQGVVFSVSMSLHVGEDLSLGQLIEIHGPPSEVQIERCLEGTCEVQFNFPNSAMIVGAVLSNEGMDPNKVQVQSQSMIRRIMFVESVEAYERVAPFEGLSRSVWKEFGEYP